MPTYVYKREDGTTFEVVQRITADALTVCPTTGQGVKRVISGAGLIFKGQGFYITDYARKKTPSDASESENSTKSEKSEKSEKSGKKETKTTEAAAASGASTDNSSSSSSKSDE